MDVVVDPAAAGAGDHSGVITASATGSAGVRTAFGLSLESEHYDLTVQVKPRAGTQSATHTVAMVGLDTVTTTSVSSRAPARRARRSACRRDLQHGCESRSASQRTRLTRGSSPTSRRSTCTRTRPSFSTRTQPSRSSTATDRPAWTDGQSMLVDWTGDAGAAGFTLSGANDRLFATPLASTPDAAVGAGLWWMLSQPAAELTLGGEPSRGPAAARCYSTADVGRAGSRRARRPSVWSTQARPRRRAQPASRDRSPLSPVRAATSPIRHGHLPRQAQPPWSPMPGMARSAPARSTSRPRCRRSRPARSRRSPAWAPGEAAAPDAFARPSTSTTWSAPGTGSFPRAHSWTDGEARRDVRRGLSLARRHVRLRPSGLGHGSRVGASPQARRLRACPPRLGAGHGCALCEPRGRVGTHGRGAKRRRSARRRARCAFEAGRRA